MENYDIILDCTDNFVSKYLLNDVCLRARKVLISASATGFEANLMVVGEGGPCLRCFYPHGMFADVGNCSLSGILGAFVGIVGSWQAAEVLKIILIRAGQSRNLSDQKGKVLFFDFFNSKLRSISLEQNPNCFCAQKNRIQGQTKNESLYLTADQVHALSDCILIDVRSKAEREHEPLFGVDVANAVHISYQDIMSGEWSREFWRVDKKFVLCCSMGRRSAMAAQWLRDQGILSAYSMRPETK